MRKIAVIIPYFQREAGILGRALASIFAQDVAEADIRVLVVDDASPYDPVKEIDASPPPPAHIKIEVLRRENGGPGAARNTGFAAAAGFADIVALLDSDDTWRPAHLRRAIAALEAGASVYFSDHVNAKGEAHLPKTQFAARAVAHPDIADAGVANVRSCPGALMAEFAAREYLAHTSSIAYRVDQLGHVRMSEELRSAGEDHLFFMDLCLASPRVAFSSDAEIALGDDGVNIYVNAFEWGSERDLRRRIFNLAALKMMAARAAWPEDLARSFARRKGTMRRSIGFLLVRRTLAERKPPEGLKLAWRFDKPAVLLAPFSALDFIARRVLGGEKFLNDIE